MPRYEFKDDKSQKFWEIKREGDSFTTRFGKIGTDGQTSTKTYDSEEKCIKEYEKVVKSKTKKGYVLVEEADAPAAASGGGDEPRNAELERAIFEDLDNQEAWQVYGDWLQQEGDPRGEIIAIETAIASGSAGDDLKKRKDEIFEANLKSWLSDRVRKALEEPGEDTETIALTWKHGFLEKVRVGTEYDYEGPQPVEVLRDLFKSSATRFLRELRVGLTDAEGENGYTEEIQAISKAGKLEALQLLFLGDFEYPDETEMSWTEVGDIAKAFPVLRAIKHLEVQGGGIECSATPNLPTLETLILRTGGLPGSVASAVAKAKLENLKHLEIWFGADDYGADADVGNIQPIFEGSGFPNVKYLGLKNSEFQNDIAREIAGSKILGQLETLDLSMGTMTDEGATVLVEHAKAFQHLKKIDVSDNFISDKLVEALRNAFGDAIDTGGQEEADDWGDGDLHYYVSVGE